MAGEAQPEQPCEPGFDIPSPLDDERLSSDTLAVEEAEAFDKGWALKTAKLEWHLKFWLKLLLFIFILGMNVYWAHQVIWMVWKAGLDGGGFHLANSVLIALVTTSIANFIALVVIVAKHLFPPGS